MSALTTQAKQKIQVVNTYCAYRDFPVKILVQREIIEKVHPVKLRCSEGGLVGACGVANLIIVQDKGRKTSTISHTETARGKITKTTREGELKKTSVPSGQGDPVGYRRMQHIKYRKNSQGGGGRALRLSFAMSFVICLGNSQGGR